MPCGGYIGHAEKKTVGHAEKKTVGLAEKKTNSLLHEMAGWTLLIIDETHNLD